MKMNSEIEGIVRDTIIEAFRIDPLSLPDEMSADTIDRWDSLGHLHLIKALEDNFSVKFSFDKVVLMINEERIIRILKEILGK